MGTHKWIAFPMVVSCFTIEEAEEVMKLQTSRLPKTFEIHSQVPVSFILLFVVRHAWVCIEDSKLSGSSPFPHIDGLFATDAMWMHS